MRNLSDPSGQQLSTASALPTLCHTLLLLCTVHKISEENGCGPIALLPGSSTWLYCRLEKLYQGGMGTGRMR